MNIVSVMEMHMWLEYPVRMYNYIAFYVRCVRKDYCMALKLFTAYECVIVYKYFSQSQGEYGRTAMVTGARGWSECHRPRDLNLGRPWLKESQS